MIGDHPRWRGMNKGPQDFGLLGEAVSFRSTDGIPLKAWWLPAQGTPRVPVIIAHGIDHTAAGDAEARCVSCSRRIQRIEPRPAWPRRERRTSGLDRNAGETRSFWRDPIRSLARGARPHCVVGSLLRRSRVSDRCCRESGDQERW